MHSGTFLAFAAWRTDAQRTTPGYAAAPVGPATRTGPARASALRAPPRARRLTLRRSPPARGWPEGAHG